MWDRNCDRCFVFVDILLKVSLCLVINAIVYNVVGKLYDSAHLHYLACDLCERSFWPIYKSSVFLEIYFESSNICIIFIIFHLVL